MYLKKLLIILKYLWDLFKKIFKPAFYQFLSEVSKNLIQEIQLEIKKRKLIREEKKLLERKIEIEKKEK